MWNWITQLETLRNEGQPVVAVTITHVSGSAPREVGAKMLVMENGDFFGTIGGGHLEDLAIRDAQKALKKNSSHGVRYPLGAKTGQCCGGVVELFFEVLNHGPVLYLFGAGHVGQAVCRTLEGTPFRVHVIDERTEWIQSPLLPRETRRHEEEWSDFVRGARFDPERTYVAVMTHRHDIDQEIIQAVLDRPVRYLGLIGSRSKWARFQQRLLLRGVSEKKLAKVRCPIGVPTGGKAPQEVAISLAAELLRVHYGKEDPAEKAASELGLSLENLV